MKELLLAIFSLISALLLVLLIVVIGWYLVWKLFLSRFRFVRELLGGMNEPPPPPAEQRPARPRRKYRKE